MALGTAHSCTCSSRLPLRSLGPMTCHCSLYSVISTGKYISSLACSSFSSRFAGRSGVVTVSVMTCEVHRLNTTLRQSLNSGRRSTFFSSIITASPLWISPSEMTPAGVGTVWLFCSSRLLPSSAKRISSRPSCAYSTLPPRFKKSIKIPPLGSRKGPQFRIYRPNRPK